VDLDLSPDDLAFRDGLRTWLARHVPRAWRSRPRGLEPAGDAPVDELKAWQRRLHAAGYVGIGWPREHGGRGASLLQQAILDEELARHHVPQLIGYAGVAMLGPTLIAHGTPEQQQRFLPPILTAEALWCQGYSEPGAGSDLAALRTSAVRDGDDFVVNGQKVWTSNAHLADWMFCLVRTDPAAPKHRGISYLLVDMRRPGITVRPLVQMTKDAQFNEVFLEDVRVPVANVVGGLGNGWTVANTTLVHERRLLGNPAHTQNLFAGVVRLARRAKRTADPVVRQRLAELKIDVEAMRYHHYRSLTAEIAGRPLGIEANVTKLATTWLNHRLAETALELLGPDGLRYRGDPRAVDDGFWPYELMFSLGMIIGGGTSQIQKNIIAQRGLGLPRG
jgi:alkylation response protein AidB-like acyl-CoA dehydrogenase